MPRSNDPKAYPATFFTILNRMKELLPLEIEQDTIRDAQRMRFVWYDFRRALAKAKHPQTLDAQRISVSTKEYTSGKIAVVFAELGADIGEKLLAAIEQKLGGKIEVRQDLRDPDDAAAEEAYLAGGGDAGMLMMLALNPPNTTPQKSMVEDVLERQAARTAQAAPEVDDFIIDGFKRTTAQPQSSGNEKEIPPQLIPPVPLK